MEQFDIFLIGGSGRSGTTILSKIMSLHPDIADVPELRYLIDPDGIVDFYSAAHEWSPYHYDRRLERLEALLRDVAKNSFYENLVAYGTYVFKRLPWKLRTRYWGISVETYCPDFQKNIDALINELTFISFEGEWIGMRGMHSKKIRYKPPPDQVLLEKVLGDFLRKTFWSILQRQRVHSYLEKNTWNHLWFDKILGILPESKLVHIFRDPRDVVSSYCNQSWMPTDPVQSAMILRDLLQRWEGVKNRIPKKSFYEISLEQLVAEPEKILKKVCHFYGVAWSDELLKIDLSHSNRGRWEKHFSEDQSCEVQEILADFIGKSGYE